MNLTLDQIKIVAANVLSHVELRLVRPDRPRTVRRKTALLPAGDVPMVVTGHV